MARNVPGFLGLLVCAQLMGSAHAAAQLSPGDLSRAHQSLEGMERCTACHSIGNALSNDKCLGCHAEIRSRMEAKRGMHAPLAGRQCVECHKEHHGRNFAIVHFDPKAFNHAEAGYPLEGKHATLACASCHTPGLLRAEDARGFGGERKARTYLGLSRECSGCHADQHRGQFKAECNTCHGTGQWKPAEKFSHDRTEFKLTGAHAKVECAACHRKTWDSGGAVQYAHMQFGTCQACHADPHKGLFKKACTDCHTVESWHTVARASFDHTVTKFPLKGKHLLLDCTRCHPKDPNAKNPSGGRGFHIVKFQACADCHTDAHGGQFAGRPDKGACESCHTERGFIPAVFSLESHRQTMFPLAGAHGAVPCAKCHKEQERNGKRFVQYRWKEPLACTTCHADVHAGQFAAKMSNGCETCHTVESWQSLRFSHETTAFPLRGKHAATECAQCHKSSQGVIRYVQLPTACEACHDDEHAGQMQANGVTACARCHAESGWKDVRFDHMTQSRFQLTGRHAAVPCTKCHKPGVVNGKTTIIYKPLGTACTDCHTAR